MSRRAIFLIGFSLILTSCGQSNPTQVSDYRVQQYYSVMPGTESGTTMTPQRPRTRRIPVGRTIVFGGRRIPVRGGTIIIPGGGTVPPAQIGEDPLTGMTDIMAPGELEKSRMRDQILALRMRQLALTSSFIGRVPPLPWAEAEYRQNNAELSALEQRLRELESMTP